MTAIVAGQGLGLTNTSLGLLGGQGQLGVAGQGRAGEKVVVNAASGNLVVQQLDEWLVGIGPDVGVSRTYNSQATEDGDNGDNWRLGFSRKVIGTYTGLANSTVQRIDEDGATTTYVWNGSNAYVSKTGGGSFDTLTWDGSVWTWTDGDTQTKETYGSYGVNGQYRLNTVKDTDTKSLTLRYAANGLVDRITAANNEYVSIEYGGTGVKNILSLSTWSGGTQLLKRVSYGYDGSNRLSEVKVDLKPEDATTTDNRVYVTNYTYHTGTTRLKTLTQSGQSGTALVVNSTLEFGYDTSATPRVNSVKETINGVVRETTFNYGTAGGGVTKITDPQSQVTELSYDTSGYSGTNVVANQLKSIKMPAPVGGIAQVTSFEYDADGNVKSITDPRGRKVNYGYDLRGNRNYERDAEGHVVERTYSAANLPQTVTIYTGVDPYGQGNMTGGMTTRYVYNNAGHLVFEVSPTGMVTEHKYADASNPGHRTSTLQYSAAAYNLGTLTKTQTPLAADLGSWAGNQPKSGWTRTDYGYDTRGQLSSITAFAKVDATTGNGMLDGTQSVTNYVYDSGGRLLQKVDGRGHELTTLDTEWAQNERKAVLHDNDKALASSLTTTDKNTLRAPYTTTYAYDGLGRLLTQTDGRNYTTTTLYDDANLTTKVTQANNLITLSTYDAAGHLLSVARSDGGNSAQLGTTNYTYDTLGRLVAIKLPATGTGDTGQISYIVYDAAGRKVADIDPEGALTEYSHNQANQVTKTHRYANAVDPAKLVNGGVGLTLEGSGGLRPAADAGKDRISLTIYDKDGRVSKTVDPAGAVVAYRYDGAGRLMDTLAYSKVLTAGALNTLYTAAEELAGTDTYITVATQDGDLLSFLLTSSATNRRTRNFYSADGQLIGQLDAENYYTENTYDKAGRLTKVTRYAQAIAGTVAEGNTPPTPTPQTTDLPEVGQDQTTWYLYNASSQLVGMVDAGQNYTAYEYDTAGNKRSETRYANLPNFAYTGSGTITVNSSSEDQKTLYRHDGSNRLIHTEKQPAGLVTDFEYDSVGNLTKTTTQVKATGQVDDTRVQQRRYDMLGRLIAEMGGVGSKELAGATTSEQIETAWNTYATRYAYDNAGRRIATIEPNGTNGTGNKTVHYYDKAGRLTHSLNALGEITEYTYNIFGEQLEARQYVKRYDNVGNGGMQSAALRSALGALRVADKDGVVSSTYNMAGLLATRSTKVGDSTAYAYNAFGQMMQNTPVYSGRMTTYHYDRRGLLKQTSEWDENVELARKTQNSYDAFGRLVKTIDGRDNATVRRYDRLGRMLGITDSGSSRVLHSTSYDAFGRVMYEFDASDDAASTSYRYDSTNRTLTITTPMGDVSITTFNNLGQTVKVQDGRGNITTTSYNADGQLSSTRAVAADGITELSSTRTAYDQAGRILYTIDERRNTTFLSYDGANRLTKRWADQYGLSQVTKYVYDGRGQAVWVQNPNLVWTKTEYNAKGEVTAVVVDPTSVPDLTAQPQADGSPAMSSNPATGGGLALRTEYTFDSDGQVLTIVEAAGSNDARTTQYTYDALGRRIKEVVDPGTGGKNLTTEYAYDQNDNLLVKIDAKQQVTRYVYDKANHLSYQVDATGAITQYNYDANGRLSRTIAYAQKIVLSGVDPVTDTTLSGFLQTAANASADQVSYNTYDFNGRLSSTVDALGYLTRRLYDQVGNVITVLRYKAPITPTITLTEDRVTVSLPAPLPAIHPDNMLIEQTVYDEVNRVIGEVDAEGGVTLITHGPDAADNPNRVITRRKLVNKVTYPTGQYRLTKNVLPLNTASTSAAYALKDDTQDQITITTLNSAGWTVLVKDPELYATRYSYDKLGNVKTVTRYGQPDVTSGTSTANQVTQYTYDNAGRQTDLAEAYGASEATTTHTDYDKAGRITDVTVAANSTSDASKTHYNYDKAGRLLEEIKAVGKPEQATTRYVLDNLGQRIKVIDPRGVEAAEGTSDWAKATRLAIIGTEAIPTKTPGSGSYQKLLDAFTTTQEFDGQGNLTKTSSVHSLSDVYGAKVEVKTEFDAFGNAVKVTDPNGNAGYFFFDKLNQATWQVDPMGYAIQTEFDAFGQVSKIIKYDTSTIGALSATVKFGAYANASAASAAGSTSYVLISAGKDQITRIEHDRVGRQTKIIDAENFAESMTYDALGNKTTFTAKSSTSTVNDPTKTGTYTYTYDKKGNLKTEKLPEQAYAYDPITGNPTGPLQDVINYYEYDARGNRTKSIEAQGLMPRITNYTYDKLDRQLSKTGEVMSTYTTAGGTATATPTETRKYDKRGNVIEVVDANGARTLTYWNALNRKTAEVKEQYIDGTKRYGVLTAYDHNKSGDVVSQRVYAQAIEVPTATGGSRPAAAEVLTGVTVRTINYTFDANHRQITQTIVGNGGILVGEVNPITGNYEVRTQDLTSSKHYDASGNVIKDIDARGNVTWHYYDKLGNQTVQVDAERYVIEWAYDASGNVKTENKYALKLSEAVVLGAPTSTADVIATAVRGNPQDRKTELERDKLGRVKTQTLYNVESDTVDAALGTLTHSTTASAQTKYEYNGLNQVTKKTEAGSGTEVTDWTYDKLGREIKKQGGKFKDFTAAADEVRQTTGTEYNALGLTARTTEHGKVTTDDRYTRYFYGTNGVLLSEQKELNATQKAITRYQYDAAGQVTSQRSDRINTAGTATSTDLTTFTYDLAGRQIKQTLYNLSGSDATLINNVAYTALQTQESKYDVFGSIVNKRTYGDTVPAATAWQEFAEYDVAGHLSKTNSGDGVAKAYVYDANGNATLKLTSAGADLKTTAISQLLGAADVHQTISSFDKRNQLKESMEALSTQASDKKGVTLLRSSAVDAQTALKTTIGVIARDIIDAGANPLANGNIEIHPAVVATYTTTLTDHSGNIKRSYVGVFFAGDYRYGQDLTTKLIVGGSLERYYSGQVSYYDAKFAPGPIFPGSIEIQQQTPYGNISLASAFPSRYMAAPGANVFPVALKLEIHYKSQPKETARVLMYYRPKDSTTTAWSLNEASKLVVEGKGVDGWFVSSSWDGVDRGEYDIRYVAVDAAGKVINSQSGTMNLQDTGPTINQAAQTIGGAGKAFLDASGNINLTELTTAAATAEVKVRVNGNWITLPDLSPAVVNGASTATPGWFKFNPTTIAGFAYNQSQPYDYIVTTKDAGGNVLSKASGAFNMATSTTGTVTNALTSSSNWASTVHFQNLPKDATTVRVLYKATGSSATPTVLNLERNSATGSFDWATFESVVVNPANTYELDYEIQAFDAHGQLLHDSTGKVKVGAINELVANSTASATPAVGSVVIKPQVATGAVPTSVKVYYRAAGSAGAYSAPVTISSGTEGLFTFNATSLLPSTTASGQWDYYYEAFAGTTKLSDSRHPTLANPGRLSLGTAARPAPQSVLLGVANDAQVSRTSQMVNAFGDVIEQVDALGRITTLRYNAMGKLVEKLDPITEIVDADGTTRTGEARRPSTKYFYDLQGRLVGTEDANGHRITQLLLEAGEGQTIIKKEFHPDGGIKRNGYDVFGDLRYTADEMSASDTDTTYRTLYEYDKAHRLVKLTRPTRTNYTVAGFDLYTYDQAGNRIKHQTSSDGSTSGVNFFTDTTTFDALGRATRTDSAVANRWVKYDYVYDSTIKGVNDATVGGWKLTTTNGNTTFNVLVDYSDIFGHKTRHIDLSGRDFTYRYNVAGWLVNQSRTDAAGQNIDYAYYADGRIKSLTDKAANTYTLYEYDRAGNKTYEGYATSNSTGTSWNFYQQATIAYDELNRVKSVIDPQYRIEYQYDAVGNRRHLKAFKGSSTTATQDYWYSYDSMNRFSVTMGKLQTVGSVTSIYEGTTGDDGVYVIYDKVGRRAQVNVARDGHREDYDYSTDGFLTNSYLSASTATKGNKVSERLADLLGRVENYTEYEAANGTTVKAATSHAYTYDADGKVKTDVNNGTTTTYVMLNDGTLKETHSLTGAATADTYYAYQWWDDAKQLAITTQEYNPGINKDLNKWKPGTSFFNYDVNGHASSVEDVAGNRSLRYATNAQGLILVRDEIANATVNKTQNFFYFDGARIGEVGNDATAKNVDYAQALASQPTDRKTAYKNFRPIATSDFDQNYTPISPTYPGFTSAGYTAQGGEKLQDVAQAVWGDASLWYLLADANGLTSTTPLVAGQVLVVPNKVTNIHNNSTTKAVYNAAEAMGDTSPTLPNPPPPPKKGCGGIGQILMVVVAVVATAMTGFLLGPALLTALGPVMGVIAGAAVAGAVGSIASQVVGLATGDVKKFSWSSVATSAISAAVTAGVGGVAGAANTLAGAMVSAAVSNVATQGVLMAVGLQKKFSWTAVAVSAAGAGASFGAGELLQGAGVNIGPNGSFGEQLVAGTVKGMAGGWAGAMARHEKPNWSAIATQSFGSALGDSVVGSIQRADVENKLAQAQADKTKEWAAASGAGDNAGNGKIDPRMKELAALDAKLQASTSDEDKSIMQMMRERGKDNPMSLLNPDKSTIGGWLGHAISATADGIAQSVEFLGEGLAQFNNVERMGRTPEVVPDSNLGQLLSSDDLTLGQKAITVGIGTLTSFGNALNGDPDALGPMIFGYGFGKNLSVGGKGLAPQESGTIVLQTRPASIINESMVEAGNQPAWLTGTSVENQVVSKGAQYNMVINQWQAQALMEGKPAFGAWATTESVLDQVFARNNLAILKEFKEDVSFLARVETTTAQRINSGFAGGLGNAKGTAHQVEFIGNKNLRLVGQPQPLPPKGKAK